MGKPNLVFFKKKLNLDLKHLQKFLLEQYERMEKGEILKDVTENSKWKKAGSYSTSQWLNYNVFQFYEPEIHALYKGVRTLTQMACKHYRINFDKQQFMVQGWFNVNERTIGKLDWHNHGNHGAPHFHGYFCVNAQPSSTLYKESYQSKEEVEIVNKNNVALISECGSPHKMGDWGWKGKRITIAYDVSPIREIHKYPEQHWIPLI